MTSPTTDSFTVDLTVHAPLFETLRMARAELAKWKEVEKVAADRIKDLIGDAETATINGYTVATYESHERTDVDVKAMRADLGDLISPYLRTRIVRTFRLVD